MVQTKWIRELRAPDTELVQIDKYGAHFVFIM